MHRNLPTPLTPLAKNLRKNPTDAERRLWYYLQDQQSKDLKFRRQISLGKFIVDFYCHEKKLIIGLDSSQHVKLQLDKEQDAWLAGEGFRVLRFWDNEVLQDTKGVLEKIWQICENERPLSPALSPEEKGSVQLKNLSLTNFRNIESLELSFDAPITAFVGENGQGKTNILESITLLALGKSLRASEEKQLVRQGAEFFRIVADISDNKKIEIAATTRPRFTKQVKVQGRKIGVSELPGQLPIVTFFPEDLNLILLSPSLRRRYLDVLLSQVSREYLRASLGYGKALRQRNALLGRIAEGQAKENELGFWDSELAKNGVMIGRLRSDFIAFAEPIVAGRYRQIADTEQQLVLRLTGFNGAELVEEKFVENLIKLREKDLRYSTTNYGPHRQDLVFELAGVQLVEHGSRGEIRSSILALKFSELAFLETKLETKPLLLLDDVYSELDRSRQEHLMELLAGYQTFITTTKEEHLETISEEKQVFEVVNGCIKKLA